MPLLPTFKKTYLLLMLVLASCSNAVESSTSPTVEEVIDRHQMTELMEGVYISIDYRSVDSLTVDELPKRYEADHVFFSTIYYLITPMAKDSFHTLKSDEVWHWYEGDPVKLTIINEKGKLEEIILGNGKYQHTVRAGSWYFSNQLGDTYSLVGLVVVPGFEDSDFTPGNRKELTELFPQHQALIFSNTSE